MNKVEYPQVQALGEEPEDLERKHSKSRAQ